MIKDKKFPVTCSTKNIAPGGTYVAIRGHKTDGALFIPKAIEHGAELIVVDKITDIPSYQSNYPSIVFEQVENTRQVLATRSAEALGNPAKKLTIIGITGTKGKSTCTYLTHHILTTHGYKTALLSGIKNKILDQEETSSLTTASADYLHMFFAQCVKAGVTHVVMEVSSHALSLYRTYGIEFASVGFTNLEREHLDYYKDMEEYFQAKYDLFEQVKTDGTIVINQDSSWGQRTAQLLADAHVPQKLVMFNQTSPSAHRPFDKLRVSAISKNSSLQEKPLQLNSDNSKSSAPSTELVMEASTGLASAHPELVEGFMSAQNSFTITRNSLNGLQLTLNSNQFSCPQLFGEFNAYNITLSALLAQSIGIPNDTISHATSTFAGTPGRLQLHTLQNGAKAFVDFAHNASGMEAVLKALRPLTKHLIIVFGCGGDRDKGKRPAMGALAQKYGDEIIITDDNPRTENSQQILDDIVTGIEINKKSEKHVIQESDRKKAIALAAQLATPHSIIALLGKGHEEYYLVGSKKMYFNDREEIKRY